MKSKAMRRYRPIGTWKEFLWVVIAVTGCDITDNPPQSLHMAAFKGNERAVESSFKDGATPDDRGQDGERPLHFALKGLAWLSFS